MFQTVAHLRSFNIVVHETCRYKLLRCLACVEYMYPYSVVDVGPCVPWGTDKYGDFAQPPSLLPSADVSSSVTLVRNSM